MLYCKLLFAFRRVACQFSLNSDFPLLDIGFDIAIDFYAMALMKLSTFK